MWNAGKRIVAPGFIDLHHHGAIGLNAGRVRRSGHQALSRATSTTAWLPTVGNGGPASVMAALPEGTGGARQASIWRGRSSTGACGQEAMDEGLVKVACRFEHLLEAAAAICG